MFSTIRSLEKGTGSGGVLTPVHSLGKTNKTFFRSKHRPMKYSPDEPAPKSYRWWCPETSQTSLKWLWCFWMSLPKKQHFPSSSPTPPHPALHHCSHPDTSGSCCHRWSHLSQVPSANSFLLHPLYCRIPPSASRIWHIQPCENHRLFFPKACSLDGWEYFPWEWQEIFLTETPYACHIASPALRPWELHSVSK